MFACPGVIGKGVLGRPGRALDAFPKIVVTHIVAPALCERQKALVRLEDEGVQPYRGTTTICPNVGPQRLMLLFKGKQETIAR